MAAPTNTTVAPAASDAPRLFRTKNDLPADSRAQAVVLLNQHLADCIDLQTQCKQAHWNVKGPTFIALHKLFDEINEDVEDYIDLIAERIVQLGGVAEGTARVVADRSSLDTYPLTLVTGAEHVDALSSALAAFGRTARSGIEAMDELEDADTADILTEISRGVDKWLWFVEAHEQGVGAEEGSGRSSATGEGGSRVARRGTAGRASSGRAVARGASGERMAAKPRSGR
jgi:starvation-inducible DNA-binding protein